MAGGKTGNRSTRARRTESAAARWFFDNSLDMFAVVNREGLFTEVNDAWERVTGWTRADLVGTSIFDLLHEDSFEEARDSRRRMKRDGHTVNQLKIRRKNGDWMWIQGRSRLDPDDHMVGTLHDITDVVAQREELEAARKNRSMLSEAAGIGTWSYEPHENRIEWSDDTLALTGWAAEDVDDPEKFYAIIDPSDRARVGEVFGRGVTTGDGATIEHRLLTADGRWLTMRATFRTERRAGRVFALKGISQDVSALADARDAARAGEARVQALMEQARMDALRQELALDAAEAGAFEIDHGARTCWTSEQYTRLVGRQLTYEEISRKVWDFVHEDDRASVLENGNRIREGVADAALEFRIVRPDGEERWVRVFFSVDRETQRSVGLILDIDDGKRQQLILAETRDAARAGEARVQALMEQARVDAWRQELALGAADAGAFEIDHAAGAFWASEQFYRLVGRRMTFEEIALPVWPFVHREDRGLVFETNRRWARGEENISMEFRIVLPDGGERWVRCFYRLDRPTRKGVGLVLDIDARKRQELALVEAQRAAEAGAEAKAAFLANMSHEIRTPMNGVLGVMHLLKSEANISDDGRRLLDEALSCGQMLSTLLDDVIDFERIEAGRLELQDDAVDAGELARSVFRLLEPQARAKGLTLTLEGAEGLGWVRSDPVRLRQCLFNLMGNAVKFTPAGGVTLTCARPAPGRLAFAVKDTGVGIPLAAQDRLFERFHQADASTTRRFGGSGLGLTITRKLAEMMGGEVSFFSRPGLGSTFRIEIAAPDAQAAAPSAAPDHAPLEGLRFLVVEDNPTNRMIAVKLLESLGASAQTACDGASGVTAAGAGAFDLILMDIQMPDMDGLEACRRIRAQGGPSAATPIIALTANVLSHQRDTYLAAGMDGVVGKPVSPAALLAEISRLAAGSPAEAAVA